MYELITTEFMIAELRAVKTELTGDLIVSSRDIDVITDSSVLGNADSMLFYCKELCAS